MTHDICIDPLTAIPKPHTLWSGTYKIPWNDPQFSRRMLREHLTQDHDLASRRSQTILDQARWLHHRLLDAQSARILDLGCGPGLYAGPLTRRGHCYLGIDFGPASIRHANEHFAQPGRCQFVLGDILDTPYGGPHDLVTLLYGELNVFSPQDCSRILAGAHAALAPQGRIALEVHTFDAVRKTGQGNDWYAAPQGLFSDRPHLCLTRNHWYADQHVSLQCFHVLAADTGDRQTYHSTMQAWTNEQYRTLLEDAGFRDVRFHQNAAGTPETLMFISAQK